MEWIFAEMGQELSAVMSLSDRELRIALAVILMILVLLLWIRSIFAGREQEQEKENRMLHKMLEIQEESLERFIASEKSLHKLKHDMENRMYAVRYLLGNGKLEEGYAKLQEIIQELCGESGGSTIAQNMVGTVVRNKETKMEACGIRLEKDILLPERDIIDKTDLCILLGSLIDNAIEAADKSAEKRIRLRIWEEFGCLFIMISNTYSREWSDVKYFVTNKEDKDRHGFGMKSIKEIVRRYHGELETEAKEEWFKIRIMIYAPK